MAMEAHYESGDLYKGHGQMVVQEAQHCGRQNSACFSSFQINNQNSPKRQCPAYSIVLEEGDFSQSGVNFII
jgi:hypothetical protein